MWAAGVSINQGTATGPGPGKEGEGVRLSSPELPTVHEGQTVIKARVHGGGNPNAEINSYSGACFSSPICTSRTGEQPCALWVPHWETAWHARLYNGSPNGRCWSLHFQSQP